MSEKGEPEADLARTAVVAADTRLPEIYLVVSEGQLAGRRFRLHKQRIVIGAAGRGANNDIDIDIPTLSARHAAVELSRNGTVQLWDLQSSNGSYLNDQAIAPGTGYTMRRGDTLGLGPDLVFTLKHPGDDDVGSVTAARNAAGAGQKQKGRPSGGKQSTATHSTPPGISSDVPLGKILGYLVSGGIVVCTLFGLLNDAFDFVGLVKGFFGAAG